MFNKREIISEVFRQTGITLDMFKAQNYWVIVYDNEPMNIYETRSVYVNTLNDLSFDTWVSECVDYVNELKENDLL